MKRITLKAARVNAGMTLLQAAARLHVNKATLSAWENGKKMPRPIYFEAACRMYGFSPNEIFLPGDLT